MKGKLIVLEGGEGSGKDVCASYVYRKTVEILGESGIIHTREPGGTQFGLRLREILLHDAAKRSVLAELLVYCADRADHCDILLRPALESGKIVLCNRYDPSTIAYQIFGRGYEQFSEIFLKINSIAKGAKTSWEVEPDLVVWLDVWPDVGIDRVNKRAGKNTRFDDEALEFHQNVRRGYLEQYEIKKKFNWIRIDANQPEETVKEEVWQAVKKTINKEGK